MILVVEAVGSSLDAPSPTRYSPLRRSAMAQARAATSGSSTSLAVVCCTDATSAPAWISSTSVTTSVTKRLQSGLSTFRTRGYGDYDESGSTTRSMVADTILMSCASSDLIRRVRETPSHRLLRRVGRRVVLPFFRQRRDRHGLAHATPTSPERGRQCTWIQGEERRRPCLQPLGPRCLRTHLLEYPE